MTSDSQQVHTAIVLQGGGALGAYEFGVLKALYELRPGFKPVAVAGISIGAITAAVLGGAKGDPIEALERLWREKLTVPIPKPAVWLPTSIDQSLAAFGNPGMYEFQTSTFMAPWAATNIYSTAPLRRTLAELVDVEKLNDDATRVSVGATDVATGDLQYFDNTWPGGLTFEHVAASGSLPPGFPMTEVDGKSYWDGGLFSNTPLAPAINALEQAGDGDRSARRELIVIELFPMHSAVPTTMAEVMQRMVQMQYTSRMHVDHRFFDKIDGIVDVLNRIEDDLPANSAVREDPVFKKLTTHRKIDNFHLVTSKLPTQYSKANDFSRASIEARIEAGYNDAIAADIGSSAPRV